MLVFTYYARHLISHYIRYKTTQHKTTRQAPTARNYTLTVEKREKHVAHIARSKTFHKVLVTEAL
jgi:hypothetical protein